MRIVTAALLSALAVLSGPAVASAGTGVPVCVVSNLASNTVSVIDAAATPTSVSATVPVGTSPEGVAITPDGRTALVADAGDGVVLFIDTATNATTGGVAVGLNPHSIAVSPDGSLAFVTNIQSNTLSVIDMGARAVTATVPVGAGPGPVTVSPDGRFVYVGNFSDNVVSVSKIDVSKLATPAAAVIETIAPAVAGFGAEGLAVSPDGRTLYVADLLFHAAQSRSVAILDVSASPATLKGFIGPFADFPGDVTLAPDGTSLLVSEGGRIDIVATATNTVGATLTPALGGFGAAAFSADSSKAYITAGFDGVSVFAIPAGGAPLDTVTVGSSPVDIACGLRPPAFLAMAQFAPKVVVEFGPRPQLDRLTLRADLTLGAGNNGLDPTREDLIAQVGATTVRVPAGAIRRVGAGRFAFSGTLDNVQVTLRLTALGAARHQLDLTATGAGVRGLTNPVTVRLTIGDDLGTATVNAAIRR